jgi:hypothetical protein
LPAPGPTVGSGRASSTERPGVKVWPMTYELPVHDDCAAPVQVARTFWSACTPKL